MLRDNDVAKSPSKKRLPVIKCRCGVEILVVPDLEAMTRALEAHVREHAKKQKDPFKAAQEAEAVRDDLIKQLLKKTSESKL